MRNLIILRSPITVTKNAPSTYAHYRVLRDVQDQVRSSTISKFSSSPEGRCNLWTVSITFKLVTTRCWQWYKWHIQWKLSIAKHRLIPLLIHLKKRFNHFLFKNWIPSVDNQSRELNIQGLFNPNNLSGFEFILTLVYLISGFLAQESSPGFDSQVFW